MAANSGIGLRAQVAEIIRQDQIDILIELAGSQNVLVLVLELFPCIGRSQDVHNALR